MSSHSTWVRELKFSAIPLRTTTFWVALHVSAWVEIDFRSICNEFYKCRTPRECVSWNPILKHLGLYPKVALHVSAWVEMVVWRYRHWKSESHSTWVRELKSTMHISPVFWSESHSTWVRELKSLWFLLYISIMAWSALTWSATFTMETPVALHVSAWVEMQRRYWFPGRRYVALHVSAWVEITIIRSMLW